MKTCPYCAEEIQDAATKCRFCGEWLNKMGITDGHDQQRIEQSCPDGACTGRIAPSGHCSVCGLTFPEAKRTQEKREEDQHAARQQLSDHERHSKRVRSGLVSVIVAVAVLIVAIYFYGISNYVLRLNRDELNLLQHIFVGLLLLEAVLVVGTITYSLSGRAEQRGTRGPWTKDHTGGRGQDRTVIVHKGGGFFGCLIVIIIIILIPVLLAAVFKITLFVAIFEFLRRLL